MATPKVRVLRLFLSVKCGAVLDTLLSANLPTCHIQTSRSEMTGNIDNEALIAIQKKLRTKIADVLRDVGISAWAEREH